MYQEINEICENLSAFFFFEVDNYANLELEFKIDSFQMTKKIIRLFITYFKKHRRSDKVYAGRASGISTGDEVADAARIMIKRDSVHHKNEDGFTKGEIDEISFNEDAIRGREQNMIDYLNEKGICENKRNGIGIRNKKRNRYLQAALKLFGRISIVLYFLYLCNIA